MVGKLGLQYLITKKQRSPPKHKKLLGMLHPASAVPIVPILQAIQTSKQLQLHGAAHGPSQPLRQVDAIPIGHGTTPTPAPTAHFKTQRRVISRLVCRIHGPRNNRSKRIRLILRPPRTQIMRIQKRHVVPHGHDRVRTRRWNHRRCWRRRTPWLSQITRRLRRSRWGGGWDGPGEG